MKTTTNYGFKQPEGTDIVNIDDISDNFGSVDTEIKKANDKVVAHEGKGGTVHADVTTTTSGFMSASDKTKLNGIAAGANKVESSTTNGNIKVNGAETNVYTHPTGTNPHGTTKADIGLSNVTNDSQVKRSEIGVANGVATLDANGVNKQPPASHASTGTSYGVADTSNYGHVKIGNGIAASSGTISVDVGDGVVLSGTSPNQKLVADVGTGLTLEGTSPNKKIALANSGVTAGTYSKVTVDAKGRVTAGTTQIASDIPNLDWSKITSGKPTTLGGYGITDGQQYALTQNNGLSISTAATDFNDITETGNYIISNASIGNSPTTGAYGLLVVQRSTAVTSTDSITQTFISTVAASNAELYVRVKNNNAIWSTWKKSLTNADSIQQYQLTQNTGDAKFNSVVDFNLITDAGQYGLSSSNYTYVNAPSTYNFGTLEVIRRDAMTMNQVVYLSNGQVYTRGMAAGIWGAWRRIIVDDDFETGNWTSQLTINGATTGITQSNYGGWYVKSGNVVTVGGYLALTSKGILNGEVKISGLPFTAGADWYGSLLVTNMSTPTQTCGMVRSGTKTIEIYVGFNGAGGWSKLQNTHISNNTTIGFTITYRV